MSRAGPDEPPQPRGTAGRDASGAAKAVTAVVEKRRGQVPDCYVKLNCAPACPAIDNREP